MFPLLLVLALPGMAVSQVDDAAADNREPVAKEVEEQLIAPCCWRQPLSQHYSGTAEKMKDDLRQMLADGQTHEEIIDHYKAMYGERILSSPPNTGFNRLAYLLTPLMFLTGAGLIFLTLRRWRTGRLNRVVATTATGPEKDPRHQDRIDAELKQFD